MKAILVSRCAWSLVHFRKGLIESLLAVPGTTVLGAGGPGISMDRVFRDWGIRYVTIPVGRRGVSPVQDLLLFRALLRLYREERPDLVHHFMVKPVVYGSLAARCAGVPCIVNTIPGLGYAFSEGTANWLRRTVECQYRLALRYADFTFFHNVEDRALFTGLGMVDPLRSGVLPGSGVDTDYYRPDPETADRSDTTTFLFVGRLIADKGIREFVEAARILQGRKCYLRFQVLGRRDERNPAVISEQELARWRLEGTIEWLGHVPDVRPILSAADAVVLPSYREGLSRSLLEAAAMRKPCIASDVPGCREVVVHGVTGLLVPARDVQALAAAMATLHEHPCWGRDMGIAGRERVMGEFGEKRVIAQILATYEDISAEVVTKRHADLKRLGGSKGIEGMNPDPGREEIWRTG